MNLATFYFSNSEINYELKTEFQEQNQAWAVDIVTRKKIIDYNRINFI